ncbi:hypothetical protein T492DRAFT_844174 [Pavlovales sp. CCMP2436]|nr:hypothetical protein T492DRAFT_844174 [Pavlovales sp. CCMP2436]
MARYSRIALALIACICARTSADTNATGVNATNVNVTNANNTTDANATATTAPSGPAQLSFELIIIITVAVGVVAYALVVYCCYLARRLRRRKAVGAPRPRATPQGDGQVSTTDTQKQRPGDLEAYYAPSDHDSRWSSTNTSMLSSFHRHGAVAGDPSLAEFMGAIDGGISLDDMQCFTSQLESYYQVEHVMYDAGPGLPSLPNLPTGHLFTPRSTYYQEEHAMSDAGPGLPPIPQLPHGHVFTPRLTPFGNLLDESLDEELLGIPQLHLPQSELSRRLKRSTNVSIDEALLGISPLHLSELESSRRLQRMSDGSLDEAQYREQRTSDGSLNEAQYRELLGIPPLRLPELVSSRRLQRTTSAFANTEWSESELLALFLDLERESEVLDESVASARPLHSRAEQCASTEAAYNPMFVRAAEAAGSSNHRSNRAQLSNRTYGELDAMHQPARTGSRGHFCLDDYDDGLSA